RCPVGDVAGARKDRHALSLERRDSGLCLFGGRAAATDQHQVPCTALDEPFGGSQSEATEAARNEEGGIWSDFQSPLLGVNRGSGRWNARPVRDDDLADLAGLLHVSEGVD